MPGDEGGNQIATRCIPVRATVRPTGVSGAAAAIMPSRRAAKLNVLHAIVTEQGEDQRDDRIGVRGNRRAL